ncbi:helix-turn-helix domain-containing protein [Methylobacterium planeticum]|uniref:Helix-turn-helix domain-containing protein n=1 Tax=Methylobacterium planeticum TaxID=2615211 RepID=A0A6N6MSQ8_9HYPH|nr:helix-turn-helix transcriptional regulator [Methylobacterium planeticum]KAB1074321.1 helix-turn-helix domain-containing protein [Methylobacterium planeticum]
MTDVPDLPTPLAVSLAKRLHARRLDCAFSVQTLASLARVEPAMIRAIEEGAPDLDPRVVEAVGAVLGLSPRDLSTYVPRGPEDTEH